MAAIKKRKLRKATKALERMSEHAAVAELIDSVDQMGRSIETKSVLGSQIRSLAEKQDRIRDIMLSDSVQ